ncbi:MAG: hypothetical protein CTY36_08205 [Methylocystis sp.]|nr:MAG: hypothetical protein CTY36_08205 [Methylocystis sp.]
MAREKSALAAAESQLAQRQSAQAKAQANLDRWEARSGRRAASRQALSAARRALARAQAQVERAEAEVALRREAVTKAEAGRAGAALVAPIAGFVLERTAAVGARVEAGAPLFVLGDASTVRLRATATGDDSLAIAPGAQALLTIPAAPERTFPGQVVEARRPPTPQGTAAVDLAIDVPNPDLALTPGMPASARIDIKRRGDEAAAREDLEPRAEQPR